MMFIDKRELIEALLWVLEHPGAVLSTGSDYIVATYQWPGGEYSVEVTQADGELRAVASIEWGSLDHGDEWSWDGRGWVYTGTERPYSAPWEVSDEE